MQACRKATHGGGNGRVYSAGTGAEERADHRAKFFAFGVILFEMLPSMRALEGESGTARHLDGELAVNLEFRS